METGQGRTTNGVAQSVGNEVDDEDDPEEVTKFIRQG